MLRGRSLEDLYPSLVGDRPMGLDPDVAAGFPTRSTSSTRCEARSNPEILSSLPVCCSHWSIQNLKAHNSFTVFIDLQLIGSSVGKVNDRALLERLAVVDHHDHTFVGVLTCHFDFGA